MNKKIKIYANAFKNVRTITDRLGKPVDKGIMKLVALLHCFDIPTIGSCEGHLDHGCNYPWVDICMMQNQLLYENIESIKTRMLDLLDGRKTPPLVGGDESPFLVGGDESPFLIILKIIKVFSESCRCL